jgi:hypothetical protein
MHEGYDDNKESEGIACVERRHGCGKKTTACQAIVRILRRCNDRLFSRRIRVRDGMYILELRGSMRGLIRDAYDDLHIQ